MAVATDTILQKMKRELEEAQRKSANESVMRKHIANIQLLSELLMEEQSVAESGSGHDITAGEMKAMMGDKSAEQSSKPVQTTVNHDGANGDSIFDF
ncbi:YwdI family protein [Lentibacillus sp. CBA3610]|uniref:YwdI family protein n=1 Tax=Lentibacillus sp. CBA3610 TaxID=2518176 RepID=UPI001595382F|nr:YwdI family protein [Lentibacillus sp. CBA3610]QKY70525.1 hypothetical protein Len3610_13840 [Lentibacillus sp. CBA3610]